jgi:hypothetical protein
MLRRSKLAEPCCSRQAQGDASAKRFVSKAVSHTSATSAADRVVGAAGRFRFSQTDVFVSKTRVASLTQTRPHSASTV